MRVSNASLLIPEGAERDSGHVCLLHNTRYTIRLGNHWYDRRCDVELSIDGKDVGCFRVNAGATVTVARPTDDNGCFTFYASTSEQAAAADVASVSKESRGLVVAKFKPERPRQNLSYCKSRLSTDDYKGSGRYSAGGMSSQSFSNESTGRGLTSGITGLSGESAQKFTEVSNLDYAPGEEVTITLRLVQEDQRVRPLRSVKSSNPVPASVE